MSEGEIPGRPNQELTKLLDKPLQEELDQSGLTHEQTVKAFKAYINHQQEVHSEIRSGEDREVLPADEIIRKKLDMQSRTIDPEKSEFLSTLRYAWDAVTYDRYKVGSLAEGLSGSTLSAYYQHHRAVGTPNPETISLNPRQVRMMDAMTEAAGVPYKKGQQSVEIPEKIRAFNKYKRSPEYLSKWPQPKPPGRS